MTDRIEPHRSVGDIGSNHSEIDIQRAQYGRFPQFVHSPQPSIILVHTMSFEPSPGPLASLSRPARGSPVPGVPAPHRPGLPRTPVVSHAFSSIEALQRALVQPQFEVFQVHPGRFETTIVRAVPRPGLAASLGESAAAVRSRGVLAPDATDVVVVIDAPGHAYFNGIALKPGLVLVMPAGLEFEGHAPAGFRWANLHLTAEDLLRATRALTGRGFELPAREILVRPALPADEAALLALHEAGQASPGASTGPTAESVVETWLGIVARALAGAGPDDLSGARRLGDRHRVFLAAEAHLRSRVTEPVYMSELCHATGVSERTLEYVFRERLGLTPIAYLANLRLNLARLALVEGASAPSASVATVARRFGFLHLGRFAARYRAQFQESPSTTLRRHVVAGAGPAAKA